ncbi:hypothetical protein CCACVL1_01070 [Corchorus capsularis]|uniref:Uncharacterized protein n=1 Tax=Corchorus capsularis TaxID=210143 RepID=A0A1R3KQ73_COCAP|nr:hypothetical protein CCACVL1_01070 [Corchorus capsularis]
MDLKDAQKIVVICSGDKCLNPYIYDAGKDQWVENGPLSYVNLEKDICSLPGITVPLIYDHCARQDIPSMPGITVPDPSAPGSLLVRNHRCFVDFPFSWMIDYGITGERDCNILLNPDGGHNDASAALMCDFDFAHGLLLIPLQRDSKV